MYETQASPIPTGVPVSALAIEELRSFQRLVDSRRSSPEALARKQADVATRWLGSFDKHEPILLIRALARVRRRSGGGVDRYGFPVAVARRRPSRVTSRGPEFKMETEFVAHLQSRGTQCKRQVSVPGLGRADVVDDACVYELKAGRSALRDLQRAVGQVVLYAAALKRTPCVVMRYDIPKEQRKALRKLRVRFEVFP